MVNKSGSYKDYLVWTYNVPPTQPQLWFEKLDLVDGIKWALDYWTICLWASAIYLIFIFVGRKVMETRAAFELRLPLILWNGALALFSTWSFIRVFPELFQVLSTQNGFYRSVCLR
jgi:elongation of very long chain fatty acids protein 6